MPCAIPNATAVTSVHHGMLPPDAIEQAYPILKQLVTSNAARRPNMTTEMTAADAAIFDNHAIQSATLFETAVTEERQEV